MKDVFMFSKANIDTRIHLRTWCMERLGMFICRQRELCTYRKSKKEEEEREGEREEQREENGKGRKVL